MDMILKDRFIALWNRYFDGDPSARPRVPRNMLTFSVPMTRFSGIIGDMEKSFLGTETWGKVLKRIQLNEKREAHT